MLHSPTFAEMVYPPERKAERLFPNNTPCAVCSPDGITAWRTSPSRSTSPCYNCSGEIV